MKATAKFIQSGTSDWCPHWYEGKFIPGQDKPERMYRDLTKLSTLLGLPVPQVHMEIEVKLPDGTITEHRKIRSRTFVRNFWNLLAQFAFQNPPVGSTPPYAEGYLALKFANGTIQTSPSSSTNGWDATTVGVTLGNWAVLIGSSVAGLGVASAGICVGTGIIPENFNSFSLASVIPSGNGVGQLAYSAQNASIQAYDFPSKTLTMSRTRIFNNNSGSTIIVTETGIFGASQFGSGLMILRDLLSSPVSVVNAAQLTVTYVMSMVFPADQVDQPVIDPHIEVNQLTASRQWYDKDRWTWEDRRWGQNPTQHTRFRWQPI